MSLGQGSRLIMLSFWTLGFTITCHIHSVLFFSFQAKVLNYYWIPFDATILTLV